MEERRQAGIDSESRTTAALDEEYNKIHALEKEEEQEILRNLNLQVSYN